MVYNMFACMCTHKDLSMHTYSYPFPIKLHQMLHGLIKKNLNLNFLKNKLKKKLHGMLFLGPFMPTSFLDQSCKAHNMVITYISISTLNLV
jgi:hypothetical protein